MSKSPLKNISPLPSSLLEMNYAHDVIIRRELEDLTINYLVVSFGKTYYVDAALLRGENIYRAIRKEKKLKTRDAMLDKLRARAFALRRKAVVPRDCMHVHTSWRTHMRGYMRKRRRSDWCCRASDFSSRIHLCVLSSSLSSFRSRLFRAWARCHTRAGTGAGNATDRARAAAVLAAILTMPPQWE